MQRYLLLVTVGVLVVGAERADTRAEPAQPTAGGAAPGSVRAVLDRYCRVLGVDPAKEPVEAAVARGVPTRCTFFTSNLARALRADGLRADVFLANNVLAHVLDLT